MYQIDGHNINEVFPKVVNLVRMIGIHENTRNGPVLALPEPLCVSYRLPRERVLFCPERGDNPFLNFFDGLFSLQPHNDAKFMFQFQERFREYSDDGKTFYGHYGSRLAGYGQLEWAIRTLQSDPTSRRIILQLFNPIWDHRPSRGIPCNVSIALRIIDAKLNITVFNRSNDIFWGMLGANVVQFSMLQEYIATQLGIACGAYHQISNNAHAYTEFGPYKSMIEKEFDFRPLDLYHKPWLSNSNETAYPLIMVDCPEWLKEVGRFVETNGDYVSRSDFLNTFAAPALRAWEVKSKARINDLPPCDWKIAFQTYAARKGWGN